jgi:hypothetical protein
MARSGSIATAATVAASLSAFGAPASARQPSGEGLAANTPLAVVVKVPTPWYAPRFFVTRKMRDTIPEHQTIPGLNLKAFSFAGADGHYGGTYRWKDEASANAWFTPAWRDRFLKEHGQPARLEWFDTPVVPPGSEDNGSWMKGADPS